MGLPTALAAGAAGVQALGGFFGRRARARSLAEDARIQTLAGESEARDRMRAGSAAMAAGAARGAASGFTLEGSATDVLAQMARDVEVDAGRARWDAALRARRLRNEARQENRNAVLGLVGGGLAAGAGVIRGAPGRAV